MFSLQAFMIATLIKDYSEVVLKTEAPKNFRGDARPASVMDTSVPSLSQFIHSNGGALPPPPPGIASKVEPDIRLRRPSRHSAASRPPPVQEEVS